MPGQRSAASVPLTKKQHAFMESYLAGSSVVDCSITSLGPQWTLSHGEGRATPTSSRNADTFHVGSRRHSGTGIYETCVMIRPKGNAKPVEGTQVFWGTTAPTGPEVLSKHKKTWEERKNNNKE
ncbi:hypothetical protein B0T22DRAFT_445356 [Podospora appendiculata]|uniref:Uncharacterized protein n=1 Tax=Podospora appendiculata TaxID=314037 RepID=A0AAE0X044_9PEZI|nr:hypothetical protein B0T22DRAFT_445356 [Podospora appendiculata]